MALRSERRAAPAREPGVLRIQVRGVSGRFTEWETLGSLAAIARDRGYEVEVVWLCDPPGQSRP